MSDTSDAAGNASVGWVMDQATSRRRIHVVTTREGLVRLTVEVYGQDASIVELDDEGVTILQDLLLHARARLASLP